MDNDDLIINNILNHMIYKIEYEEIKKIETFKLHYYCTFNNTELCIQLISENFADVTKIDDNGNSLFIIAATNNNTSLMNKLLDTNKVDISQINKNGFSAIYFIKNFNNEKILNRIKRLL